MICQDLKKSARSSYYERKARLESWKQNPTGLMPQAREHRINQKLAKQVKPEFPQQFPVTPPAPPRAATPAVDVHPPQVRVPQTGRTTHVTSQEVFPMAAPFSVVVPKASVSQPSGVPYIEPTWEEIDQPHTPAVTVAKPPVNILTEADRAYLASQDGAHCAQQESSTFLQAMNLCQEVFPDQSFFQTEKPHGTAPTFECTGRAPPKPAEPKVAIPLPGFFLEKVDGLIVQHQGAHSLLKHASLVPRSQLLSLYKVQEEGFRRVCLPPTCPEATTQHLKLFGNSNPDKVSSDRLNTEAGTLHQLSHTNARMAAYIELFTSSAYTRLHKVVASFRETLEEIDMTDDQALSVNNHLSALSALSPVLCTAADTSRDILSLAATGCARAVLQHRVNLLPPSIAA